jgi:hypothetical protein
MREKSLPDIASLIRATRYAAHDSRRVKWYGLANIFAKP